MVSSLFITVSLTAVGIYGQSGGKAPFSSGSGLGGVIGGIAQSIVGSTNPVANGPAPKGCSAYEIIVARGTGEPGPFGLIVGDSLVSSVTRAVPGSRGYAVQYPANINMTTSAPAGIDDTINRLNKQSKACPQQKFALVGYSQGAAVMHGVFGPTGPPYPGSPNPRPKLDPEVIPKIVTLVMFGDLGFRGSSGMMGRFTSPFPATLEAKLKENCAAGDPVCDPVGGDFENHLKYISNPFQRESTAFIVAGFRSQPLPNAIKSASDPRWHGASPGSAAKTNSGKGPKGPKRPPKSTTTIMEGHSHDTI